MSAFYFYEAADKIIIHHILFIFAKMLHSYVQTKLDIDVLKNPSKKRNVLQKVELVVAN